MRRRNFLSMISVGALAALVPKRSYFFLDGLWQPNTKVYTNGDELFVYGGSRYRMGTVFVDEAWFLSKDGSLNASYRRIDNGAWEKISEPMHWHGQTPFTKVPLETDPWNGSEVKV